MTAVFLLYPYALSNSYAITPVYILLSGSNIVNKTKNRTQMSAVNMLALPIFTARHQATIVGACELNFCVRDGNRWTLTAINTNSHRNGC